MIKCAVSRVTVPRAYMVHGLGHLCVDRISSASPHLGGGKKEAESCRVPGNSGASRNGPAGGLGEPPRPREAKASQRHRPFKTQEQPQAGFTSKC
jgi:hypothetical protein